MSPEAILFEALLTRLKEKAPAIRYIEQDLGQLENYEMRPAVSWPCALIDMDDFDFSEVGGNTMQMGEGFVQIRVGLVKYTDSNNLTPANIRPNAYKYFDHANAVVAALHNWAPPGFGKMLRRKYVTEKRDDDIRVKIIRFAISFKEDLTPAKQKVPRPDPTIGTDIAS